jgi:hypothetical protein
VWLVLCHPGDLAALWACYHLKRRGLMPIELVSADALAYSRRIVHRLGTEGVDGELTLQDGREIALASVRGALNRISVIPAQHLERASRSDRAYAVEECRALWLSFLFALPGRVLNRPTARGLMGCALGGAEWATLAARAGLSVGAFAQTSWEDPLAPTTGHGFPTSRDLRHVIVVAGAVCGSSIPQELGAACRRLAALAGSELLGITFRRGTAGAWLFLRATPLPDLRQGGTSVITALHAALLSLDQVA